MQILTLKRMMIGRTIAQKNEVLTVTSKEGRELVDKGYVVEIDKPKDDEPKTKTNKTKAKADTKDKAD
ncbi:hypothetical protein J3492_00255 [Psychrobacter sp. F1192]|uniref:Uncharacterized protein n=1 Tax=Psychrobacter coccoides TaxID=2818440 RepID=A0ABS3NJS9_9GAMM|nr:hypothetical protein [Psychrobacter coccoides]MBO1529645.1 hypothetical protein [Psychrobacter coccoides]